MQEGGNHYKDLAIQPIEYVMANASEEGVKWAMISHIVPYITRNKHENPVLDLKKARHFIDMWIEYYEEAQEK